MRRVVFVTTRVAGFHNWPEAPAEVGYLADRHRHVFHVRVEWQVDHDERQVEFHIALGWLDAAVTSLYGSRRPVNFEARSCETIAIDVARTLLQIAIQPSAVEVSEDGENGARVEFDAVEIFSATAV